MPKKAKRKTRKRKHKGGTLSKIHSDDLDCLEHVGHGTAEEVSCGACSINQIGFPPDIVDELSATAGRRPYGVSFAQMNNKINEVKNRLGHQGEFASHMYWWGANRYNPGELAVERGPDITHLIPMTARYTGGVKKKAIRGVFDTIKPGTKTILGIRWARPGGGEGEGGHFVSIAKSHSGTPYLIETQHLGCEGVYRGWSRINEYFDENQGRTSPAFLVTFNNSAPSIGRDGRLDFRLSNELELDLGSRTDTEMPQSVVVDRATVPMARFDSYGSEGEEDHGGPAQAESASAAPSDIDQLAQHLDHLNLTPEEQVQLYRDGAFDQPRPPPSQAPPLLLEPNPSQMIWQHTRPQNPPYNCSFCNTRLSGGYFQSANDHSLRICGRCFYTNYYDINPLELTHQDFRVSRLHPFCDACGKKDLTQSMGNRDKDIDFCQRCFDTNRPAVQQRRGGTRKKARKRTLSKSKIKSKRKTRKSK